MALCLFPADEGSSRSFETGLCDAQDTPRLGTAWSRFELLPATARPATEPRGGHSYVNWSGQTAPGASAVAFPRRSEIEVQIQRMDLWPAELRGPGSRATTPDLPAAAVAQAPHLDV